jgi:branched-chain amino acid transport system substrate-binding protein
VSTQSSGGGSVGTNPGVTPTGSAPTSRAAASGKASTKPTAKASATTAPTSGGVDENGIPKPACAGSGGGTITLGNTGPYTATSAGTTVTPGRNILKIWAQQVNDNGGICGRKVNLITEDSKGSTSQDAAEVRDLVENQHVVAFVGNIPALNLSGEQGYLEQKHVAVIGGDLGETTWYTSPVYFPQGADIGDIVYAVYKAGQAFPNGNKIANIYCAESTACKDGNDNVVRNHIDTAVGSQLVYSKQVSLTQISFTSECQAAKAAGVGIMFLGGDGSFVERVANSCGQQGYNPVYGVVGLEVNSDQANNQYLNNHLIVGGAVQSWGASNTPGSAGYQHALATYGPSEPHSGVAMTNWAAALLAQYVLGLIGDAPVTQQSVFDALYKVKGFTIGGLAGPISFVPGNGQTTPQCPSITLLQNGVFTAANGGNLSCRTGPPFR